MKKSTYFAMYSKSFLNAVKQTTEDPKNSLYEYEKPYLYIIANILNDDPDTLMNLIITPLFNAIYDKDADYIEKWGSLEYHSNEDYDLHYFDVSGEQDADSVIKSVWSDLTDEDTMGAIFLNLFKNPCYWSDAQDFLTDTIWALAKDYVGG